MARFEEVSPESRVCLCYSCRDVAAEGVAMHGVCSSALSHVLDGNAAMLKAEIFSQISEQFLVHGSSAEVSRHRSANVDHDFMLQLLIITGTVLPKALMHLEARRNEVWQAEFRA